MSDQTARLGIMTADTFANRTKATKAICGFKARFKNRGSNMASIDRALAGWDMWHASKDIDRKLRILNNLQLACLGWQVRKRGKGSNLSNHRRQVIQEVLTSTKRAMHYLKNKQQTNSGRGLPTKQLGKGYQFEREQYVAGGKQSLPYAAGGMHGQNDASSNQIDLMQIADLNAYIATGSAGDEFGNEFGKVHFFNRADRMGMMAFVEGGLFYAGTDKLHCPVESDRQGTDFTGHKCLAHMYAVDRHGNLFHKQIDGFDGTFFNHSSFCAGREIICAGTAIWTEGKLKFISNNSGHYKPPPPQLRYYLTMLGEEDVDLDDVCVQTNDKGTIRLLKGTTFLQNMRATDDWPHMMGQNAFISVSGQLFRIDEPAG